MYFERDRVKHEVSMCDGMGLNSGYVCMCRVCFNAFTEMAVMCTRVGEWRRKALGKYVAGMH